MQILAWTQKHLQKSMSVNTVQYAIYKCKSMKLCHAKTKPYVNTIQKQLEVY